MYRLYGQMTSRAFRVMWALEEMGLDYELIDAGPQSDTVRAVSAPGKIPALEVDGIVLTDSVAILTFLADRHQALAFPAGSTQRGLQDGWTERVNDECDALLWTAARHGWILPAEHRVAAVIPALKWEFGRNMNRLARDFKGPFLMGDTFTIADIVLGHCIGWATLAEFPIESEALRDYGKAMRARDAYKAARARG